MCVDLRKLANRTHVLYVIPTTKKCFFFYEVEKTITVHSAVFSFPSTFTVSQLL